MPVFLSSLIDAPAEELAGALASDESRCCLRDWLAVVPDPARGWAGGTCWSLDLALSSRRLAASGKVFRMKKFPRAAILDGKRAIVVVFEDALDEIFGMTDIIAPRCLAFQNVYVECHGYS